MRNADLMDAIPSQPESLTSRERDILRLVALGLSNRDIAEELVIAQETVRWYSKQIYSKLAVSGRLQAVNRARELGLLEDDRTPAPESTPAISTKPAIQHNLPVPITSFIGRGHELAEVGRLLQTSRLLTLTGVGGTGKSRLALVLAAEVAHRFADGVFYVDLAPLTDYNLVPKAIAGVLGVIENPAESQQDTLKRALSGREILLLLDSFEHVIAAGPVIAEMLAASQGLKVLVTSREALRLSGEQEYPVPPLSLPASEAIGVEQVMQSEAGALFVRRVQMMMPRFEVTEVTAPEISQICARLDGLPLAIELAAARCKLLSPQAMLARLDHRLTTLTGGSRDAPLRQQTLRRTLDWSYNLLDEGEKVLFARLAVFRGGRSLEAIETVCGPDLSIDVLDGLASLVDKSLVQQKEAPGGEPRFVLLETIHEYAYERLTEGPDVASVRKRYAEYFAELAERARPQLRMADHARWAGLLELEIHNLRAVLEWSLGDGDFTLGVRLAAALYLFWWAHGYHVEGQRWIQPLLARLGEAPIEYHAPFLLSGATVAIMQYDLDMAVQLLKRSLDVARVLQSSESEAWALGYLGFAMLDNKLEGLAAAEAGLALFRELDYKPGIAQVLNFVGMAAAGVGRAARAQEAYEECLHVSQQTGDTRMIRHLFHNLTFLALHQGDSEHAWHSSREALQLAWQMQNRLLMAMSLAFFAGPVALAGQARSAAMMLGTAETTLENMGAFYQPIDRPEVDRIIASLHDQLDAASFEAAWVEGQAMTLDDAVALALDQPTDNDDG